MSFWTFLKAPVKRLIGICHPLQIDNSPTRLLSPSPQLTLLIIASAWDGYLKTPVSLGSWIMAHLQISGRSEPVMSCDIVKKKDGVCIMNSWLTTNTVARSEETPKSKCLEKPPKEEAPKSECWEKEGFLNIEKTVAFYLLLNWAWLSRPAS